MDSIPMAGRGHWLTTATQQTKTAINQLEAILASGVLRDAGFDELTERVRSLLATQAKLDSLLTEWSAKSS